VRERVLVVDDEAGVRASLAGILADEGYAVDAVESGEAALAALEARHYDLVLLDVWLPGADGLEVLGRMRESDAELPVVVISGHGTIETAVRAVRLGAQDFVEKPLSLEKTLLAVRNALQRRRLESEVRALKRQLDERYVMVGESPAMRRLRADIEQAAPSNGRALIFGENGTGKELVARAIHARSLRASGPFVEVNCAAIPEELIESELFGHVKGAFTGALAARKGKFELADGGTLFLDEIGDMSLKTQAKVLRALQEQRIEPVGGAGWTEVDVRVIAATNKNLEEEIQRSRFREDLYFRLNVIPFRVPPLRERREDVPLLVRHFMDVLSAEHGRRPRAIAPEVLAALARLPWPGNVRELRNIIERLVIMAPGDRIELRHLPSTLLEAVPVDVPLVGDSPAEAPGGGTLAEARETFERGYILARYRACGGNMSRTAEALGVERSNLYRKMKAYGLLPARRGQPEADEA
jgi:two-component system, NtrC family, nitrogen regulation response regulator NtrX